MRAPRKLVWTLRAVLVLLTTILPAQSRAQEPSKPGGPNSRDPRQTLAVAKTVAVVARLGEVAQTGRWVMDPDPGRAGNALIKALQQWGRLTLVEDASQADLVLLIIEGNRSSFMKKGELFERLLVFPGGSGSTQQTTALWQEEGKEGLSGRPAAKLVAHLRKQIEDYEKTGPPLTSAGASHSGPGITSTVSQSSAIPTAEPVAPELNSAPPAQQVASANAHSAEPLALGSRLESRMLQPVPDKFVPSAELLKAKTVAVVSFGPQPEGGAKGFVGNMLTGTSSHKQANAQRAKEQVESEISKWNRYTLVDNPAQADLVIAVREWNRAGFLGREYLASSIMTA